MHKSSKCDIIKYVIPCLYYTLWWNGWCDIIKVRLYQCWHSRHCGYTHTFNWILNLIEVKLTSRWTYLKQLSSNWLHPMRDRHVNTTKLCVGNKDHGMKFSPHASMRVAQIPHEWRIARTIIMGTNMMCS